MATTSGIAKLPYPERTDLIDAPGSFAALTRKLDDLVVVPYASASARSAAFVAAGNRAPAEGTITFLRDSDTFEFWDGSAWQPVVPSSWARGIIGYTFSQLTSNFPATGYVAPNTEQIIPASKLTVPLISGRVYRVVAFAPDIDGGPGSTATTYGGELRIRYTTTSSIPTTSSVMLTMARAQTLMDSSAQTMMVYCQRLWQAPATGTYTFALGLHSYNTTGGVRLLDGWELSVEDVGTVK